jgi:hypothetical protein
MAQHPQFSPALYLAGHTWHCAPVQELLHMQLQPVTALPLTAVACPLQFAMLQAAPHSG